MGTKGIIKPKKYNQSTMEGIATYHHATLKGKTYTKRHT